MEERECLKQRDISVEALGKANRIEPIPATPDQIASVCYTSVRLHVL